MGFRPLRPLKSALRTDIDDRFWAAAELWLSTGQSVYRRYVTPHFAKLSFSLFERKDPSALGMTDLWWPATHRLGEDELTPQISAKLIKRADFLREKVAQSGYRLANHRFVWGSNKMIAEEGITLVFAHRLTGNPAYLHAAVAQVDYLFGRNHFNQTFVTGVGTRPVRHIAHIFARTKIVDIPGLAVGGPNDLAQCNLAPKHQGPLRYIDHN
ncbi:MAG: glycoside hydrolase family 9 protein [Deltaproteobacteria bacterium]|nr:glycoside hydrolase family 9 protein [Deltaproteobacteria bacterium]